MPDVKISALPAATTPLTGTELVPIVQSGVTDKVTVADLTAGRTVAAATINVDANSATDAVRITQTGAGNALVVEDSANPDASPFVVDANGNVGIGTSSPDATRALTLNRAGNYGGINFQVNGSTQARIQQESTGSLYIDSGITTTTGSTIFRTANGSERMRIDSSGNVGIGTSSPGNKLDIVSAGSSQIRVKDGVNATAYYDFGRDGTDGFFGFSGAQTTYSGYKWSVNAGSEVMRITNGGNVGIGTSSPASKLSVSSASTVQMQATTGTVDFRIQSIDANAAAYSGTVSNHAYAFTTNNSERARIDSSGNVIAGASAALATNATDGFLYVPTCAGTPTGTPTAITGMAPIVVNTTNNKLYFYSGGAWRDAGP